MAGKERIAEFKEVAELMPDDPVVRFGLAAAYRQGLEVATRNGDLQTVQETEVFLRRLDKRDGAV